MCVPDDVEGLPPTPNSGPPRPPNLHTHTTTDDDDDGVSKPEPMGDAGPLDPNAGSVEGDDVLHDVVSLVLV